MSVAGASSQGGGGGSSASVAPEKITLSEFESISPGMTEDEVEQIVGSPGALRSNSEGFLGSDYVTRTYDGGFMASATVEFKNGEVVRTHQLGLQ
ncbi:hypothetical protein GCM10010112_87270 [Actinoplanes lobatus]|nr:hypothetical protein GCM10010112_87270 [Actinoplanes lobatus]GIE45191.1 hypothetical protein Alo02nite_80890 [Actinoplanes lobatus]